ncbi:histone deacetylase family protein [Aliikangiella marina]|uniref:Histone deacetylase family protein n=1 Tax=Aliikangiella marina TaxID=1712262 RepID=A0A545TCT1_9GAMM|nr:histone deacetylase family protein [Aliikangiella marina]TQV75019.1 histone deacetylase family protein [Aliikangiella marina]
MTLTVLSHPNCKLHNMGEFHPETPLRLASIERHIDAADFSEKLIKIIAKPIEKQWLSLAHTSEYIQSIFDNAPATGEYRLDPDTSMNQYTLEAALLAAGAGIQGVDLIMQHKSEQVFCAVRPPGHHAERHRAMGFCFFDNIAIAAAYALNHYRLNKVAIVDFDVHHGNGTENIMTFNEQVLFCSTFQHPFYPFSGANPASTNIINTPLPAGAGSVEFRQAIEKNWLPALNQFKPDLLFISAGFDAHQEDSMAQMELTDGDYYWVTKQLMQVAHKHSQGRVVSMLEGGYALDALGRSVVEHLRAMFESGD